MDCCRTYKGVVNKHSSSSVIEKLKDFIGKSNKFDMRNTSVIQQHQQQQQQHQQLFSNGFSLELEPLALHHRSTSIYSLSEQIDFLNSTSSMDDDDDAMSCGSLAKCIEATLRETKSSSSSSASSQAKSVGFEFTGDVLVPSDLSTRVAESVIKMSEDEPCGIRGCVIYIVYEDPSNKICRRVGKVKCDPNSVVTFEVTLKLRPDNTGWLRLLPLKGCWNKFRNATTGSQSVSSLVVSSDFTLAKNKLYRSNQL